jgi:exopolysaccharide biosynthesis WecB/TagA/CpsF family protein
MGVPTQEIWIRENKDKLKNVKLFVAGGAILDFLSGRVKRAPLFVRQMSLEWLFRLVLEPVRLWKRYIIGNILFFYYVFALKIWCKKAVAE